MSKQRSNINRLARRRKVGNKGGLGTPETRDPIGPFRSSATSASESGSGSSAGWPLTEVAPRDYYPEASVTSSDGLFVLVFKRPRKLTFLDANSDTRIMELIDPNA